MTRGCWRGWRSVLGAASRNNTPARAMSGMGDKIMSRELRKTDEKGWVDGVLARKKGRGF